MKVKFTIPGPVQAKQRPRMNRQTGRVYTPNATHKYEKLVKESYGDNLCFKNQFISVKITFKMAIPKSYSKKKTKELLETHNNYNHKPDLDNIAKIILDSLNGIAYKDDSQVTILHINKEYGNQAKVIVELEEIE